MTKAGWWAAIPGRHYCPLFLGTLCVLAGLLPDRFVALLQYRRSAILAGEWWRIFSGHLVHLGWSHLAMNLLGLWLIWQFFLERGSPSTRCLYRLPLLAIGTSLGLLFWSPEISWYRGLSGLLHGWLVVAILRHCGCHPWLNTLLLSLLAAKLTWEQAAGALPGSESWTGGAVVVDAHLYGALSGVILWALEKSFRLLTHREVTE